MKVTEALQTAYEYVPPADKVVKSALTLATTAVALEAIASLAGAEAGPITYALCIAACTASAPPALPACLAACAIGLGLPCP